MGAEVKPFRVVLDTNVLVSALLFSGERWKWLRDNWFWGRLVPLVCHSTTLELVRVLGYSKFGLHTNERDIILADFLPFAEVCAEPPGTSSLPACRDSNDQIFLELAASAGVDYLVTGDSDLLDYRAQLDFSIVKPADLRKLMKDGTKP